MGFTQSNAMRHKQGGRSDHALDDDENVKASAMMMMREIDKSTLRRTILQGKKYMCNVVDETAM